jgi:phage baseplate assembly protein V
MARDIIEQLKHLLRPLSNRIANTVARAVVQRINDAAKQQLIQIGALAEEDVDDVEHFHPYGFFSVPLAGAEAFVLFPNGDRTHGMALVSDRRYRPTGGEPGESGIYNDAGAIVRLTKDGDIYVRAAPGRDVFVDDGSGTAEAVVTVSQFNAHTHSVATTGTAAAQTGTAAAPAPVAGTSVLKAK